MTNDLLNSNTKKMFHLSECGEGREVVLPFLPPLIRLYLLKIIRKKLQKKKKYFTIPFFNFESPKLDDVI